MVALRDRVSGAFRSALDDGIAAGVFHCPYPGETVLAIVTMCTGVAGWYNRDGKLTPGTLAVRYAELALNMLGRDGPVLQQGV